MGGHSTTLVAAARERRVGAYVLGEVAFKDAAATVHLGWSSKVGAVTIKRLSRELMNDPRAIGHLKDSVWRASRVRHPNLAAVIDVVTQDDEVFMVSEYVPGEPLARLLRAARASSESVRPSLAVAMTVNLLAAIETVHACNGLAHGAICPENVIVGLDGVARLGDLGMPTAADRHGDLYAIASILWEVLTGERHLGHARPAMLATIPRALAAVTTRGLSRRQEDRYRSAAEMARALALAWPPATPEETAAWMLMHADDGLWSRANAVGRLERAHAIVPRPMEGALAAPCSLADLIAASLPTSRSFRPSGVTPLVVAPRSARIPLPPVPKRVPHPPSSAPEAAVLSVLPPREAEKMSWGRRLVSIGLVAAAMVVVGVTGSVIAVAGGSNHVAASAGPSARPPVEATECDRAHIWDCLRQRFGR